MPSFFLYVFLLFFLSKNCGKLADNCESFLCMLVVGVPDWYTIGNNDKEASLCKRFVLVLSALAISAMFT